MDWDGEQKETDDERSALLDTIIEESHDVDDEQQQKKACNLKSLFTKSA